MIILDPLSGEADPRLYVPLDAGERALAEISTSLKEGRSPVLLTGPAGIGKTVLLMVLAERERHSYSRVRFARSLQGQPEELSPWLLRLLFGKISASGVEMEAALAEALRASNGQPVLLLVDEIHRAPDASVRKLTELVRANPTALAIVAAGTHGADLRARSATLGPREIVVLPDALPAFELEALYDMILDHPGLSPRLRSRMASVARAEILEAACGSPRMLKDELLRRDQQRLTSARGLPPPDQPRPKPDPIRVAMPVAPPPASLRTSSAPERPARPRTAAPERPRAMRVAAIRGAPASLARPFVAAGRVSRRLFESLVRACVYAIALPRQITVAALRAVAAGCRRAVEIFEAALQALRSAGRMIARPFVVGAGVTRSAIRKVARACAYMISLPRKLGSATAAAVGACQRRLATGTRATGSAVREARERTARAGRTLLDGIARVCAYAAGLPRKIGLAAVDTLNTGQRRLRELFRGAFEALRRTGTRLARPFVAVAQAARSSFSAARIRTAHAPQALGSTTRHAAFAFGEALRGPATRLKPGLERGVSRGVTGLHAVVVAAERAGRASLHTTRVAALPATALVAAALFLTTSGREAPENPPVAAAPPTEAPLEAMPRASAPPVNLQVNAKPWARVRIDGVDVGATPLSRTVTPGSYQLEAEFPDGRKLQRRIEVDPERRFVSLP